MLEKIFYGTGFGRDRMSPARAGYLFVMWVLLPLWLVTRFMTLLVGLSFAAAFSGIGDRTDTDISFRHPFVTWTGDVGFDDLVMHPRDPDAKDKSLEVRHVRFDMPNWGVMQSVLAASGTSHGGEQAVGMLKVIDHMDHIGLQVEGLKVDMLGGLPGVLGQVGSASAAPFETEGCKQDNMWVGSELPQMGIQNQGVDLQLTLANASKEQEVQVSGVLVSPHSSRAAFEEHYKAPSMSAFLDAPEDSRIPIYQRLQVDDDGFIAARDAFCAKRDGVAPEEFRERHVAAVKRLFEAHGLRPSADVESIYRQYLQHGRLVLEARPTGTIRLEDYGNYAAADQVKMFRGLLSAKGQPVLLDFDAVPARPIPEDYEGSTWDRIAAEGRATGATAGMPVVVATGAVVAAAPAAVSNVEIAPAVAPLAVPTVASATAVAAATSSASKPAASSPVAKPAATAHAPVAPLREPGLTNRTTVDGRPLASSLPTKQQRTGPHVLANAELGQHVGDYVQVTTIYGDKREGRLVGVQGQSLNLKKSAGLGYAVQNIEFKQLREVMFLYR